VLQTGILDRDGDGPMLAPILAPPLMEMIFDQYVRCVIDSVAHSFVAIKLEDQPRSKIYFTGHGSLAENA
jgi:hypothetical protein